MIRVVRAQDWRLLRELRVAALADAPGAFLAGGDEGKWTEDRWRGECRRGEWLLLQEGGDAPVALARLVDYPQETPRLHLEAMWVAPRARRRGLARSLLAHAERRALDRGHAVLGLWIFEVNEQAAQLYRCAGYRPTGRSATLPDGRREIELKRCLDTGDFAGRRDGGGQRR